MGDNNQGQENDLIGLMQRLKEKRESLVRMLEQVDEDYKAVTKTMALLRQVTAEVPITIVPLDLHGKTQLQAVIEIAQANGGRIKLTEARDILVANGLMKKTKNSTTIIYNTVVRSGKFEHTGKGEYGLLPESPDLFAATGAGKEV